MSLSSSDGLCRGSGRLLPVLSAALALACCSCRPSVTPPPHRAGERVVTLAPNLTEMVYALGAGSNLVGRTSACDYPPECAAVPVVGGFGAPSLETLAALQPTLVLDTALADESLGERMRALGFRRERVCCRSLDDIPVALTQLGGWLHCEARAADLAGTLQREIAVLREQAMSATHRPRVWVELWHDPLTTAGRGTFISELVRLAGGESIGDEVKREYFETDPEWVLSRNPEVVICLYMDSRAQVRAAVLQRTGWEQVAAVRSGAVYDGFDNNALLRPGPRVLEGIGALRKCIAGKAPSP